MVLLLFSSAVMLIPSCVLESLAVPLESVPIKFPSIRFPNEPSGSPEESVWFALFKSIPSMLPEIMLRAACDVPPIVLLSLFSIATPAEFPKAFLPVASVPIKFPSIRLPVTPLGPSLSPPSSSTPTPTPLFEMTLPAPAAIPPMVLSEVEIEISVALPAALPVGEIPKTLSVIKSPPFPDKVKAEMFTGKLSKLMKPRPCTVLEPPSSSSPTPAS